MKLNIQLFATGSTNLVGTLNGSSAAYAQFYAVRSYTQDEENVTTKETIKLYLKRVSSYTLAYNSSAPYTISEVLKDGTTKILKTGNANFNLSNVAVGSSTDPLATFERTLKHKEDGTYDDYTLKATLTTGTSLGNGSISKVVSTPIISTSYPVSISDLNISLNNVLSIVVGTRESTNYVYDLTYRIGKEEDETPFVGEIGTNLTENNKLWELNSSLITSIKEKMSDTSTLPITIYCTTKKYIEESYVQIGTIKESTAHLVITEKPQIVYPTIEEMIENIKILTNSESVVKELSKMKFTFSIEPPYGTTIKEYHAIIGERRLVSSTNELIIENIVENKNGIVPISVYVVDARGIESEAMLIENPDLKFIDYIKSEYINTECIAKRDEADIDKVSIYLKASFFNNKIGTTDNQITLGYKYKEKGASSYTNGTTALSLDKTIVLNETFDHNKNYEIVFTINDLIYTGSEMTKQVAKSQYIMFEHENGVDFLNATILGKQVAKQEDIPKTKIIQGKIIATGSYASGTYITVGETEIDTTDTITIGGNETKEVVFENNGLITLNYVGLIKLNLHLWVRGSSASSRPWIYINDYTNQKPLAEWIDDTSSGFNIVDINDLYIQNDKIGNKIGIYVFNVTGSVTPNGGSNSKLSYINLKLL